MKGNIVSSSKIGNHYDTVFWNKSFDIYSKKLFSDRAQNSTTSKSDHTHTTYMAKMCSFDQQKHLMSHFETFSIFGPFAILFSYHCVCVRKSKNVLIVSLLFISCRCCYWLIQVSHVCRFVLASFFSEVIYHNFTGWWNEVGNSFSGMQHLLQNIFNNNSIEVDDSCKSSHFFERLFNY